MARVKAVTTPEVACPVVDRNVTSTGPTMKTNSSTTDSIASAVGRRWLPRSRCVQRTRIIEDTGGMQAPASPAERKTIQQRPVLLHRGEEAAPGDDEDGQHGQQHPALAVAVGQPAEQRAGQRGGDRAGRGDRAAEAVGTGLRRDEQHAAQADHRQRQPPDERGQHHGQGVRRPQHLQVGIGHERGSLSSYG